MFFSKLNTDYVLDRDVDISTSHLFDSFHLLEDESTNYRNQDDKDYRRDHCTDTIR